MCHVDVGDWLLLRRVFGCENGCSAVVHEKFWNNLGAGEVKFHVFVPGVDYAACNWKFVTLVRTCPSASGVVSIGWWLDCGAVTRGMPNL